MALLRYGDERGCVLNVARLGMNGIHLVFRDRSRVLLQYDKQNCSLVSEV